MYKSSFKGLAAASAASAVAFLLSPAAHAQQTFNGNGATGFGNGGLLGNGSLQIGSTSSAVTFTLKPGGTGSFSDNDVVVYIDSKAGGISNTSTLTDNGDLGRESISGYNASNPSRSLVTFAAGFQADYALEFQNNVYIGFFDLSTPSNFGYLTGSTPNTSNPNPYTQTVTDAQLGLTPGSSFKFVASLISTTAYRSNEGIGSLTISNPDSGASPNAGFNGSATFSNFNTFTTTGAAAAPEPGDLALLMLGASVLGGAAVARRRRSAR